MGRGGRRGTKSFWVEVRIRIDIPNNHVTFRIDIQGIGPVVRTFMRTSRLVYLWSTLHEQGGSS